MTLIAVARNKFARGLGHPKGAPDAFELLDLREALDRSWSTDAHATSYVATYPEVLPAPLKHPRPGRQHRLVKALYNGGTTGIRAHTTCFLVDVDNPGHSDWTPELFARAMEQYESTPILQTVGVYHTAHGRRIVQPLAEPIPVEDVEPYLLKYLTELQVAGLDVDMGCKDWTRHMRMPRVVRDKKRFEPPFMALDRMRPVAPPKPDPVEPILAARPRGKKSRPAVAVPASYASDVPEHWRARVEEMGARVSTGVTVNWHFMYLALSGALLKGGTPPEIVPAIVHGVAVRAGSSKPESHRKGALDTVAKWSAGQTVSGVRDLERDWPLIADVVREALDKSFAAAKREVEESRAPDRPRITADEAFDKMTDAIRNAQDGLTVIQSECGSGKTYSAQIVAVERARKTYMTEDATGARAPLGSKTAFATDKTSLAVDILEHMRSEGVPVRRLFGVLNYKNPDGTNGCHYFESAKHLQKGGQSIPSIYCSTKDGQKCDRYATCQARHGGEGDERARVIVGPHQLLSSLDALVGSSGLLVIDEPPRPTETSTLLPADLDLAMSSLHYFKKDFAEAMGPIVARVREWTDPDLSFADQTDSAGGFLDPNLKSAPIRHRYIQDTRRDGGLAERIGEASRVLWAIYRAAIRDSTIRVALTDAGVSVSYESELLKETVNREGATVILDANAETNLPSYEKMVSYPLEKRFLKFVADDSCEVERTFLRTTSASRRSWISHGRVTRESPALHAVREALLWAAEGGSESIVLITYLPVANLIRAALGEAHELPEPKARRSFDDSVAKLRPILEHFRASTKSVDETVGAHSQGDGIVGEKHRRPLSVLVAHYGATRGRNDLKHADALATLGDPWPNVETNDTEAKFLDIDPDERLLAACRAELEQAHGRLRTVRRDRPARALHVGRVLPGGSGWSNGSPIIRTAQAGRPFNIPAMGAEELRATVDALGGGAAVSRALDCSESKVRHYLSGRASVPPAVAAALRGMVGALAPSKNLIERGSLLGFSDGVFTPHHPGTDQANRLSGFSDGPKPLAKPAEPTSGVFRVAPSVEEDVG